MGRIDECAKSRTCTAEEEDPGQTSVKEYNEARQNHRLAIRKEGRWGGRAAEFVLQYSLAEQAAVRDPAEEGHANDGSAPAEAHRRYTLALAELQRLMAENKTRAAAGETVTPIVELLEQSDMELFAQLFPLLPANDAQLCDVVQSHCDTLRSTQARRASMRQSSQASGSGSA